MTTTLRIALTGDSIIQRRLHSRADPLLAPLFDLIRGCDVGFTNVEVLANDYCGDPALESGGSHFGAPSWVLDELSEAGFGLFATATNHSLDYGVAGMLLSLAALESRGLIHAGTGRNLEDARRVAYHTHPSGTVAMVACASTFAKGQEASAQRPDMPGRPGLNPLHVDTMHEVTLEHLAVLREIADRLGLEERRRERIKLGFAFEPEPGVLPFGPMNFRAADRVALRMTAKPQDVAEIARWVNEGQSFADLVLVSLHGHEQGTTKEEPAEFMPAFAHAMIEAGADLVVCHGPHLLRGIEIHRDKPIFYSLGNFIGQNELVSRLPADSYERFRADPAATPGAVYAKRTDNDRIGFPADRRYWETVVPICSFAGRRLTGIELLPVSLGLGEARHLRGRPRLAVGTAADDIITRLAALSAPFGTRLLRGQTTTVALAADADRI